MTNIIPNTVRSILTASVIAAGFAATSADAANLRKNGTRLKVGTMQQMQVPQSGANNLVGNGHANAKPDLIIVARYNGSNGLPGTGFCGPWNGGNPSLKFYVKNIGDKIAPASDVYIGFGGANYTIKPVPAIGAGQQVQVSHPIPGSAWSNHAHPSIQFLVAADHNDDMVEESTTNNYGDGTCIGPAT